MKELVALLSGISLLFTSAVPLCAQAASASAKTRSRVSRGVDGAVERQKPQNRKFAVKDKAEEVRSVVKALADSEDASPSASLSYKDFEKQYAAEMDALLKRSLEQAGSAEEKAWIKKEWNALMTASAKKDAYQAYQKEQKQAQSQNAAQIKRYLIQLGYDIMAVHKADKKLGLALIQEALPAFAAVGGVDDKTKQNASAVLRGSINSRMESCEGLGLVAGLKAAVGRRGDADAQAAACQSVLDAAVALSILGADAKDGKSPDAEVLGNLLHTGYNGVMGPAVIATVSKGLLAMNGERTLTAELVAVSRDFPDIGLFGSDFSFISVGDWVKAATMTRGEFALGMEYSFYKGGKYANLYNAWTDLGIYLAQQANGKNAGAKYILDAVMDECVWYDGGGNPGVKFKPFVAGALAAGYQINKPGRVYDRWDASGRVHKVDTREPARKAQEKMKKLNVTQSGYFAVTLFYSGKDDLDPHTALYINNLLVDAYRKSGSRGRFNGLEKAAKPSADALRRYDRAQTAVKVGQAVDVALAVVVTTKLLASAVKMGVQGMKSGVRVLKLARAGQAANGLSLGKNMSRVVKLGRLQAAANPKIPVAVASGWQAKLERGLKQFKNKKPAPSAGTSSAPRAAKGAAAPVSSPAKPAPAAPKTAAAKAKPQRLSAASERAVAEKLTGPLEEQVRAARVSTPMAERSLTPAAPKDVKPGFVRDDGLVYMEKHPTDPERVVFYYTDKMGQGVRAKELPRAEYEAFVQSLSAQDKATLSRSAELFSGEVKSLRIEREYDRLEALGRKVRELNAQKAQIKSSGKATPDELARVRRLDADIKTLEKEASGVIKDISREQGVSSQSVARIYENTAMAEPSAAPAAPARPLGLSERSLMPTARGNVKPSAAREDGLVYMEAHPTDPNRAVLYYADETGSRVTAREVSRGEYKALVNAMSDADKAALNRASAAMADSIKSARLEREYDRLEALGRKVRELNAQKAQITASGKATPDELARVRRLDAEIKSADAQAQRVIQDIARETGLRQTSVRPVYQTAAEPVPAPAAPPKQGPLAMKDRSLMPAEPKNLKVTSIREDGLVYMEAHPTDPSMAVLYYADKSGSVVTARTSPRSFLREMTAVEKKQLQNGARLFADEIRSARIEREFSRLDDLGSQLDKLDAQLREIRALQKPTQYQFKQGVRLSAERKELLGEIDGVITDLARERRVSAKSLREMFLNDRAAEPAASTPAKPLAMKDRSLMPKTRTEAKVSAPREDGLVYMEEHPTNPEKAVLYYADEAGSNITSKEVWRSEYEKLVSSMSEADKAALARYSGSLSREIKAARLNREYDRLDDLGRRLEDIAKRFEIIKKPDYPVTWAHAEAPKLTRWKRDLSGEVRAVMKDIAREQGVTEASVRQTFQNAHPAAL